MRVLAWIIFAAMLWGGILMGVSLIAGGGAPLMSADMNAMGVIPSADQAALRTLAQGGTVIGIAVIALMAVVSVVFLASMNVWLDLAENVRRISGRLSRRMSEEE